MPAATPQLDAKTAVARRHAAGAALEADAPGIVDAAQAMALRFRAGGTLLTFGSGVGTADAAHVAVEFLHPVVVGKPALPAISLVADVATLTGVVAADAREMFAVPLRLLARPGDIALAVAADGGGPAVVLAVREARARGLLTVGLLGAADPAPADGAFDHVLAVADDDPQIVKEVHVTMYHLLWELVHVFLEHGSATANRP